MPIYGEEKRLQMARSILPSRARKSARSRKTQYKRQNRRKINMLCQAAARDWEVVEDAHFHEYPDHQIAMVVGDRRDADKLNHFERWAPLVTEGPPDARLAQMRAMLPKGLIGYHAISHLEWYDEFRLCPHLYKSRPRYARNVPRKLTRSDMAALLYKVIEDNRTHRLFNQFMRLRHRPTEWIVGYHDVNVIISTQVSRGYTWSRDTGAITEKVGPDARLCTGFGDIDTFLDDVFDAARSKPRIKVKKTILERRIHRASYYRRSQEEQVKTHTYVTESVIKHRPNPKSHSEWLAAVREFLGYYRTTQGDYEALRRMVQDKVLRPR